MAFIFQVLKESEENARAGALLQIRKELASCNSVEELRRRLNDHYSLAKSLSEKPTSTISPARAETYASAIRALEQYVAPALNGSNPQVLIESYRAIASKKGKTAAVEVYDWALANLPKISKKPLGQIVPEKTTDRKKKEETPQKATKPQQPAQKKRKYGENFVANLSSEAKSDVAEIVASSLPLKEKIIELKAKAERAGKRSKWAVYHVYNNEAERLSRERANSAGAKPAIDEKTKAKKEQEEKSAKTAQKTANTKASGKRYDSINDLVIDYVGVLTKNYAIEYDWGGKIYNLLDEKLKKGSILYLDCSGFTGTVLQTISTYLTVAYSDIPVHSEEQYYYFLNLGRPKGKKIRTLRSEDKLLSRLDHMDKTHVYVGFRKWSGGSKHIGLIVYNEKEKSWYFIHNSGGVKYEKMEFKRNKKGEYYAEGRTQRKLARLYVADTHAQLAASAKKQRISEANLLDSFTKVLIIIWNHLHKR